MLGLSIFVAGSTVAVGSEPRIEWQPPEPPAARAPAGGAELGITKLSVSRLPWASDPPLVPKQGRSYISTVWGQTP